MKLLVWSLVIAAVLLLSVPQAQCDEIKWAQDRKHLFVTVFFDCSKSQSFKPQELKFHLVTTRVSILCCDET